MFAGLSDPSGRVQAHTGAALLNFCEHLEPEDLDPYTDELVSKIAALMQQGSSVMVQEAAVGAISAIADSKGDKFLPFYGHFMPPLKMLLIHGVDAGYRNLRARAIECVSILVRAVGKEACAADLPDLINIICTSREMKEMSELKPNPRSSQFVFFSLSRFVEVIPDALDEKIPQLMEMVTKFRSINFPSMKAFRRKLKLEGMLGDNADADVDAAADDENGGGDDNDDDNDDDDGDDNDDNDDNDDDGDAKVNAAAGDDNGKDPSEQAVSVLQSIAELQSAALVFVDVLYNHSKSPLLVNYVGQLMNILSEDVSIISPEDHNKLQTTLACFCCRIPHGMPFFQQLMAAMLAKSQDLCSMNQCSDYLECFAKILEAAFENRVDIRPITLDILAALYSAYKVKNGENSMFYLLIWFFWFFGVFVLFCFVLFFLLFFGFWFVWFWFLICLVLVFGLVGFGFWFGLVLFSSRWFGLVQFTMVWFSLVWFGFGFYIGLNWFGLVLIGFGFGFGLVLVLVLVLARSAFQLNHFAPQIAHEDMENGDFDEEEEEEDDGDDDEEIDLVDKDKESCMVVINYDASHCIEFLMRINGPSFLPLFSLRPLSSWIDESRVGF